MAFKPFIIKVRFETPEEADEFLQGCIIAQSNNNSPKWRKFIDGVNAAMISHRKEKLEGEMAARAAAGMP